MDGDPPVVTRRSILHVDMDAFFVAVELLRRPELRGLPVVVGGTGERGVVAAASYEARRYGVHSAMPSVRAQRLCPQAVFLPGDHARYAEVSREVHTIFQEHTPLVEPIALDEAFLDVTGAQRLLGSPVEIATRIRGDVQDRLGLTCSVGVAPTKLVAKLASEAAKPTATRRGIEPGRGVVEVVEADVLGFLHAHPVQALWGVGPATLERLQRLGVVTVGDLAALGEAVVVRALGRASGQHLAALARGDDDRPVVAERAAKSIGHEETFAHDRHTHDELRVELVRLADAVATRLRAHGLAARTVTLKVRFHTFQTVTRSVTLPAPVDTASELRRAVEDALLGLDVSPGVRLCGLHASGLQAGSFRQLTLDEAATGDGAEARHRAEETVDEIRSRFGAAAIGPAGSVVGRAGGLRVLRPGWQQWGPERTGPRDPDEGPEGRVTPAGGRKGPASPHAGRSGGR